MERFTPIPLTADEMAISDMMWEGGPPPPFEPKVKNSQFPERNGRIRPGVQEVLAQAAG